MRATTLLCAAALVLVAGCGQDADRDAMGPAEQPADTAPATPPPPEAGGTTTEPGYESAPGTMDTQPDTGVPGEPPDAGTQDDRSDTAEPGTPPPQQ